ncbi:MAG: S24 family peptidase [Flavobacterium sp.]|nr:S24 family peptidase [Pedobacter sp.]
MKTQQLNINQLTAFEAVGNAMVSTNPNHYKESIYPGSIVIGMPLSVDELTPTVDGTYIVVTKSGNVLIKNVAKVANEMLVLHSLNEDFEPGVLALNEVTGVYKVVQVQTDRCFLN